MKSLTLLLSAVYALIALMGMFKLFTGGMSVVAILFCVGYLCIVAALNQRGGKAMLMISYFVSGVMSLMLLVAVAQIFFLLFGQEFDSVMFFMSLIFGAVGVLTLFTFKALGSESA